MKKKVLAIIMGMSMAVMLMACGEATGGAVEQPKTEEAVATVEETGSEDVQEEAVSGDAGYEFKAGSVSVYVNKKYDEVGLPEAKSVYEIPSCAGQGMSYVYDFGSYQITTVEDDNGENIIAFIDLMDDLVATPEGIDLSKTRDDIIAAYGEPTEEDENGTIKYEKNGGKLVFIIEDDTITSIEYVLATLG